jgi:hypothetical protein
MNIELRKTLWVRGNIWPTQHLTDAGIRMRKWDRRAAYLCAAILCLMAIGHGIAFADMSQSLAATTIDPVHAQAIRTVWLTVSAMLASFGLLLLRAAHETRRADWVVIVTIGTVLALSGAAGLAVSAGQPFWWQHVVLGAATIAVGWRSRGITARG